MNAGEKIDYPVQRRPPNSQNVVLMPKQEKFVYSEAAEILYSGAFRAGKTRALCYRAVRKALQHPSAKFGLVRKTMVDLKRTTLTTLLEPDGDLPPVLPQGSYHYHKAPGEMKIQLHGGGQIIPIGCDDHTSLGSLSLSDLGIDEGIELDFDEYIMLSGRCSVHFTLENGQQNRNTVSVVTNPGPPNHFLHDIFFKQAPGGKKAQLSKDVRLLIETNLVENPYLPKDYKERMIRITSGPTRERVVYGKWVAFEGAIYPMFDPKRHVIHLNAPYDEYVAGVDIAYTHKTAVRVHGVYGDRQSHCVAEFYQNGTEMDDIVEACKSAQSHYRPITFVVDTSAAMCRATLKSAGLHVKEAQRDVKFGIKLVQNALATEVDGVPRMTFEPGLDGTDEYLSYRWTKELGRDDIFKDVPVKEKDDALDADRYARMEIEQRSARHVGLYPLNTGSMMEQEYERFMGGRLRERMKQDQQNHVLAAMMGGDWN